MEKGFWYQANVLGPPLGAHTILIPADMQRLMSFALTVCYYQDRTKISTK